MSNYDPQLALRQTIAGVLDHPSVYMGGPSRQNLQKADRIIERLRADTRLMEALRASQETCEQCSGAKRTPDGLNCTACNAMGESAEETRTAPDNSGVCSVCGWPVGHCNVGCTASSHQRIKIGDRVRLAIGTNTMLPTDGWTVYKLPSHEWRSYGLKHDNGGDMSINAEYVVPV